MDCDQWLNDLYVSKCQCQNVREGVADDCCSLGSGT